MHTPWSTSPQMDQAHWGPFILCSCSRIAFIWLQVAVNLVARFLKNFCDQNDQAHMEIPQLRQANKPLARKHVPR